MDEVYNLPEPYARASRRKKPAKGRNHNTKWIHQLDPGDPQGRAARIAILIFTIQGELAQR